MSEFRGFEVDIEEEEATEETPEIDLPTLEDIFPTDTTDVNLGQRREGSERISKPFLGKLAKARLIAARAGQLQLGAPPMIPRDQLWSYELQDIAQQEFEAAANKQIEFPIKIVRKFADGTYEVWKVSEFKYFARDTNRPRKSRGKF
jgi:DNA-directed RNA polymerase subunit K/omega